MIQVLNMEHFDQNESAGNASTKYIIEFDGPINCVWSWDRALNRTLDEAQRPKFDCPPVCNKCGRCHTAEEPCHILSDCL